MSNSKTSFVITVSALFIQTVSYSAMADTSSAGPGDSYIRMYESNSSASTLATTTAVDLNDYVTRLKEQVIARVESFLLDHVAKGNKKQAKVTDLSISNGALNISVWVRHHHVWDSPLGRVTVYDLTGTGQIRLNPLNPDDSLNSTRICIDIPPQVGGGQFCISARQLASLIGALALE